MRLGVKIHLFRDITWGVEAFEGGDQILPFMRGGAQILPFIRGGAQILPNTDYPKKLNSSNKAIEHTQGFY